MRYFGNDSKFSTFVVIKLGVGYSIFTGFLEPVFRELLSRRCFKNYFEASLNNYLLSGSSCLFMNPFDSEFLVFTDSFKSMF